MDTTPREALLACQEAFERWAIVEAGRDENDLAKFTEADGLFDAGDYHSVATRIAWDAWQAAWNRRFPTPEPAAGAVEVMMPLSDVNDLDEVCAVLGIQDSHTTPAEAVRELLAEIERLRAASVSAPPGWGVAGEVATERRRQVEAEGWTPSHDDIEHGDFECGLIMAAITYAAPEWFNDLLHKHDISTWPWDSPPKFKDRRRDLVRAAALVVAEIERLDRMAERVKP